MKALVEECIKKHLHVKNSLVCRLLFQFNMKDTNWDNGLHGLSPCTGDHKCNDLTEKKKEGKQSRILEVRLTVSIVPPLTRKACM